MEPAAAFRGPHGSKLYDISKDYPYSRFEPTDRHGEPAWVWDGVSGATATFDCGGTCALNGGTDAQEPIRSTTAGTELPGCTFTPPEGMTFKAWQADGYEDEKQPGQTVSIPSGYTMTVTALWKEKGESTAPQFSGHSILLTSPETARSRFRPCPMFTKSSPAKRPGRI